MQLSPDARILGFTILLSVVSSLVFGLVPAFHGAKSGVIGATKDVRVHRSRVPLRGVLLSLQVGVAVVLLVAAALIANAVRRISAKDLGFTGQGVAVVTVEAPARGFDPARTRTVTLQIADALSRRPNVVLTSTSPLGSGNIKGAFTVPGNSEDQFNSVYEVSPGYFEFLHIPIVAGRPIEIKDADRPVIVINESMARTFWNSPAAAIGRHIVSEPGVGGYNRPGNLEIVGVVRDVHATSLATVDHTIYQPLSGRGLPQVLTSDDPGARDSVRKAIESVEPRLRVRAASLSANLEPRVRGSRTAAMLAGAMGTLALTLAAIGMFAVFACWVQQRTHEIGVRMALGARATQIVWLLLRSSIMSIAVGALAGLAGAAAVSRVLQSYMFGLSAADPLAYGSVILVVAAVGALATCWPARRAVRVDPVHALRYE